MPLRVPNTLSATAATNEIAYRFKHDPSLGRDFETMDPLECLASMADHIPDPGRHRSAVLPGIIAFAFMLTGASYLLDRRSDAFRAGRTAPG